ncbi:MAG: ImmA/IrrE family metallo-endopeptidase, partial [Candidatus Tectomicrobia bacterium]|nr:ImmA/IrrE family metallo-endopeptidase [Candidatus Tectomicrobia bacterium]
MPISQKELGRRLRAAREACRMTQDDVARHLQVSRSTVAQMELGNRGITGLELDRLAYLFGRDIREFFTETFNEEDVLVVLFRAHPDVIEQEEVVEALRRCLALGREVTSLDRLLGLDGSPPHYVGSPQEGIAAYPLPTPRSKWEAVSQGARVSEEERRRLGLGIAPLVDIGDILEAQGVHTILAYLPEDISGFTLSEASVGIFVVANRHHLYLRQRFSFAHEYAHVLLDRGRRGTISRSSARDELIEV